MTETELATVLYTATATAVGGRLGTAVTDDGHLDLRLAPPRKRVAGATNPEQLFAVGYAACFTSALAEVAQRHRIDTTQATVSARVHLGTTDTPGGYGLAVELTVALPGVDHEQLQALLHDANATCPYSQAVRGNIPVKLTGVAVEGTP